MSRHFSKHNLATLLDKWLRKRWLEIINSNWIEFRLDLLRNKCYLGGLSQVQSKRAYVYHPLFLTTSPTWPKTLERRTKGGKFRKFGFRIFNFGIMLISVLLSSKKRIVAVRRKKEGRRKRGNNWNRCGRNSYFLVWIARPSENKRSNQKIRIFAAASGKNEKLKRCLNETPWRLFSRWVEPLTLDNFFNIIDIQAEPKTKKSSFHNLYQYDVIY